jgi:hypothetical protein
VLRPFLSLLIAGAGTVAGLTLNWLGASAYARSVATMASDPGALVLTIVGVLLLAAAALSLAVHWVGILVVGAIHALLGLLALVVPFGNPFGGGIFSPVFQITRMLGVFDQAMADGATVFFFSGTALVVGAFLVGAALGVRSRRLVGPSSRKAVAVSSALGAVVLLGATTLLIVAGGSFVRSILMLFKYDALTAGVTVVAGVLAGLAGILLRWSSIGAVLAGALVLVTGIYLFASPSLAYALSGNLLGIYGLVMVAGATFLAAAVGGTVRGIDEVSEPVDAL